MTDATRALIARIRRVAEKVENGKRWIHPNHIEYLGSWYVSSSEGQVLADQIVSEDEAHLFAHAPSWLSALCDALEEGEHGTK